MNTNPTVSRFTDRAKITVPPNTRAKADEEADSYNFTNISSGHHACDSGKDTHIIIEKDGKIGCSCGDMTYRCTGTDVCKHIAAFLDLDVPPQISASEELIRKLILMGWVGGRDDLHPAELLCAPQSPLPEPEPYEEPDPVLDQAIPEMPEPPNEDMSNCVAETPHYECPNCGAIADAEEGHLADWILNHLDICPGKKATEPPEEPNMAEEQTKTYTHPDGTEFQSAEALLDYADGIKEAHEMEETKALISTSEPLPIVSQAWSDDQIEVMKRTVAEKATPAEFAYFMEVARGSGLNPFLREIYFMKTDKGQTSIITGRDGLLTIAKRDRRFKGIQSMDVCEKDEFEMAYSNGVMEVTKHIINDFRDRGEIIGAWARGEMNGETPVTAYASIKEYDKGTHVWKTYKSAMIKKVPESMVLKRMAGISGLVTEAEVSDSQTFVMDAEEMQ